MGQPSTDIRDGIPWCYVAKHFATEDLSGFLFVPLTRHGDVIAAAYPGFVLNRNPFRLP